ncbi:hypothetical protein BDQ17DRAFT_1426115 [Cyathus striatus]|nr:hypothetical protein BDQ17DRAFT_1426115 [Cyathus striatus]
MSQDNCAQNQDGSLKDASQIQWFNDIDDEIPLSQPGPSKSNLKPSKTKRARLASFLDLEAEVASGLEDEDPIDSDDDFINDFMDDEDNNIDHSRLSLTQAIEAEHGFIDHLTNKYVEKSRHVGNHSGRDGDPMFSTHKHSITHSGITPQDWPMFDIPVKEGSKEIIVHMLTTQAGPKHIRSAFASAMIPGHVYVEGHNLEDVKKCAAIYSQAFSNWIHQTPTTCWNSFPKLSSTYIPTQYSWVWLKGNYCYDLAFVTNVCDHSFRIDVIHLPRILYKKASKKHAVGSSKSKIVPLPPCDSFNVDRAREITPGELLVQYEDAEKKYTLDGFIVHRKLDTDDYYQVNAMPTINELRSFEKCDQVKIMLEGGKDYLAFVEDIEGENVLLNLVEFLTQVFSQSLELLQKFFKVGDGVRVKSGEHKGRVGMVTTVECNGKIGNETITFVAFPLGEANHLQIHSSDLDHCNEVQRSTTFRWPDGKSDSPVNSTASYGSEAYQMRVDPHQYQYGKYAWSISTSNVAQLEVPECLMFSKDLVECPMKDLYIPGYSDKSMNDFFTAETTRKDTKPALGVCLTPRWEHDSGIGSQTPLGIQAQ